MALIVTPNASSVDDGAQIAYPLAADRGLPGQIADLTEATIRAGHNETAARIPFGIPVRLNGSGLLNNSCTPLTAAGAILGLTARTAVAERDGPSGAYADGIPIGAAVNILTRGPIYLEVIEAVALTDSLRYFKSGTNAGKWGKTASAGNSLLLTAGNWAIRKAGAVGTVLLLEINTPAALSFTAD
jgi:hypothetical protein